MAAKKTTKKEEVTKQEQQTPEEVQQEQQPKEVKQAAGALKVGDEITVTGRCFSNAVSGGMFTQVEKRKMYITQILNDEKYCYKIGVAKSQDGTRFGWISKESIDK